MGEDEWRRLVEETEPGCVNVDYQVGLLLAAQRIRDERGE